MKKLGEVFVRRGKTASRHSPTTIEVDGDLFQNFDKINTKFKTP